MAATVIAVRQLHMSEACTAPCSCNSMKSCRIVPKRVRASRNCCSFATAGFLILFTSAQGASCKARDNKLLRSEQMFR